MAKKVKQKRDQRLDLRVNGALIEGLDTIKGTGKDSYSDIIHKAVARYVRYNGNGNVKDLNKLSDRIEYGFEADEKYYAYEASL